MNYMTDIIFSNLDSQGKSVVSVCLSMFTLRFSGGFKYHVFYGGGGHGYT